MRDRDRQHPHTFFHGPLSLERVRKAVMRGDGDSLLHGLAHIVRTKLGHSDFSDGSYLRQRHIYRLLNNANIMTGHFSVREWTRNERNVELDGYIILLAHGE